MMDPYEVPCPVPSRMIPQVSDDFIFEDEDALMTSPIAVESDDDLEIEVTPSEDREVRYSPVFESNNIVRALILALRCGIKAAQDHPMSSRRLPNHGETMGGECGLMDADGLEWKTLPNTKAWNYQGVVRASKLYLWKMIGHGATGRAYLACTSAGTACVLKFILFDDRSVSSLPDDEKDEATKKLLVETKQKTGRY
jgi:hypothetical protein